MQKTDERGVSIFQASRTTRHLIVSLVLILFLVANCSGGGSGGGEEILFDLLPPAGINKAEATPEPDITGGDDDWLIPVSQVVDGGPGKDGIPSIDNPVFVRLDQAEIEPGGLIIGMIADGDARAIPHDIMDWHEVLNDDLQLGPIVLSYCPLTGSALLWESNSGDALPDFGVSGLLYNSNLILYDRQTDSHWSQMQFRAVRGQRRGEVASAMAIVEMTIERWRELYPGSTVLSRQTGFSRDYDEYPYGSFKTSRELLFPVFPRDTRLHEKERIVGIQVNGVARAYVIDDFNVEIEIINDVIDGLPIVVMGSSSDGYGVIFKRILNDGTELSFSAVDDAAPALVRDNEGTSWDLFGRALTGPRLGERLRLTNSHVAYWFAWGAFHPQSEIHGF